MLNLFNTATNGVNSVITIGVQLLVGVMMVLFTGLPLVLGGIMVGLVPLGIGSLALFSAWKGIRQLMP